MWFSLSSKRFHISDLRQLEKTARNEGFSQIAFLKISQPSKPYKKFYRNYLNYQYHADMQYLENTTAKYSLSSLWPHQTKPACMMVLFFPYRSKQVDQILKQSDFKIARYAWGQDYHKMLRKKLKRLLTDIAGDTEYRILIDSTPFPERYYARKSNLGFIGKNSMLINPVEGSYFFIATVLFDKKLPRFYFFQQTKSAPVQSFSNVAQDIQEGCKNCNLCIQSCPTKALKPNAMLDARLCLSYLTIESKEMDALVGHKRTKWIFGCDICQMVCPYNRITDKYTESPLPVLDIVQHIAEKGMANIDNNSLNGTALKRAGHQKLSASIRFSEGKIT